MRIATTIPTGKRLPIIEKSTGQVHTYLLPGEVDQEFPDHLQAGDIEDQPTRTPISPEVREQRFAKARLQSTDNAMIRVVEDLVAALKAKGVITDADLPAKAVERISERQAARAKLS